jgi:hypothetical protein
MYMNKNEKKKSLLLHYYPQPHIHHPKENISKKKSKNCNLHVEKSITKRYSLTLIPITT